MLKSEFELKAQSMIQIEDSYTGFEEFYDFFLATRPEAGTDTALKRVVRKRFRRCRRDLEGNTIIDYAASVWQLVKAR